MRRIVGIFALCAGFGPASAHAAAPLEHFGICDGSAAVAVGADRFLVANDDDQTLRLYRRDASGPALDTSFNWSKWLDIDGEKKKDEVDIEGAAQIGKRIYWIGSHGLNTKGKVKPKRRQLFATDIDDKHGELDLKPFGTAYAGLLPALLADKYGLREAAGKIPEKGGLNIEGLAATPQGHLLLGFRSPVIDGKALIVPLRNADALLTKQAVTPDLGDPIRLPLGGRGIRSIDYAPALRAYLIIAGPAGKDGDFKLYKWSGAAKDAPVLLKIDLDRSLRPEALLPLPDGKTFQLLSDDGDDKIDGTICKDYEPKAKRKFRSVTVTVE